VINFISKKFSCRYLESKSKIKLYVPIANPSLKLCNPSPAIIIHAKSLIPWAFAISPWWWWWWWWSSNKQQKTSGA